MAVKRVRPIVIATVDPATESKLREVAGNERGRLSAIVDAALRAHLGLPPAPQRVAA